MALLFEKCALNCEAYVYPLLLEVEGLTLAIPYCSLFILLNAYDLS